mmetsp:Transcript_8884/g.13490  ORF Transcript_8884/g.13490 Transcript_8884/m.13490 type:complete len:140 (+) Transcript_8884:1-420(+)
MIFNFFLFTREGECLYYKEWNRKRKCESPEEEQKLLFGLLFSLKTFCEKSCPSDTPATKDFHYFTTSTYKLHFYETPTGLKFILLTDPSVMNLRDQLKHIYAIYVKFCVKDPLYKLGTPLHSEAFEQNLQNHVKSLSNR